MSINLTTFFYSVLNQILQCLIGRIFDGMCNYGAISRSLIPTKSNLADRAEAFIQFLVFVFELLNTAKVGLINFDSSRQKNWIMTLVSFANAHRDLSRSLLKYA